MKKLISIGLVVAFAGSLVLAETKRAEAIDPASAALIGASFMLLPLLGHLSHEHDHYRPAPHYYGADYDYPYPAQTRVYYRAPRHASYYGGNWNRGYRYERHWQSHRGPFEDRRGRDYYRDRHAGRYYRDRY